MPHNAKALPTEIELKLTLPAGDTANLARTLARSPLLARRQATREQLHNVYFDTPDQHLRRSLVALRMRRVASTDGSGKEQWLQTLKMGGRNDSALSQRGEWETASRTGDNLDAAALKATPWAQFDPDGSLFAALQPGFTTSFERSRWLVKRRDLSQVEIALDIGRITAGQQVAAICELEIELRRGTPAALFDAARQLAGQFGAVPGVLSKSARGYALAEGRLEQPQLAGVANLHRSLTVPQAAGRVLREAFGQFTINLNTLLREPAPTLAPEVVHQVRVGWRRYRSGLRFFKPALVTAPAPSTEGLQPLLAALGELRDLDVACLNTLPQYEAAYVAGDAARAAIWQTMVAALQGAAATKRRALLEALATPGVGLALLETTEWLEQIGHSGDQFGSPRENPRSAAAATPQATFPALRNWAKQRLAKLDKRLQEHLAQTRKNPADTALQHATRIEAKRLRYATEALAPLLPSKNLSLRARQASGLQTSLGLARDLSQASVLTSRLNVDPNLVAFLRGISIGFAQSTPEKSGQRSAAR